MTRLLIVGPPGAGKGTQATRITQIYSIPAISTGDIFRANIAAKTPLGVEVKSLVDSGRYVPDDLTNRLVKDRLDEDDVAHGFLLDGYPRTLDQVAFLDQQLSERSVGIDAVVQLVAETEEVVRRLVKRAVEQGRSDDTEDVLRHRLEVYNEQTAPLIDVFAERGLLVTVDGLGELADVTLRIVEALAARGIHPA